MTNPVDYILQNSYWPQGFPYWPVTYWYWPIVTGETPPTTCFLTSSPIPELTGYYYLLLRGYDGIPVALFDDWRNVSVLRKLNASDELQLTLSARDPRIPLFLDDARLELWRSVPGISLDWYVEATGLIVEHGLDVTAEGDEVYQVNAAGGTDLADRREINYQAGTIRADKSAPSETAMKEYVYENLGTGATTSEGRFLDGNLSDLIVETTTGYGATYQESNAGKKLLATLQTIAEFTRREGFPLDFSIEPFGNTQWVFKTYPGGRGADRTDAGLNPSTGLNAAGYAPVSFSVPNGTLSSLSYRRSRRGEANVVTVWGSGDGSTRKYRVRSDTTRIAATPYNQREISINATSQAFQYQLDQAGDATLAEHFPTETLEVTPLQQAGQMYGLHYFLGDRITAIEEITSFQEAKRIVEVGLTLGGDGLENFSFKLD